MSSNLTTNNIPVGIGYDSNGDPKGFVELSLIKGGIILDILHTSADGDYSVSSGDRLVYVDSSLDCSITLPLASVSSNKVITIFNKGTTTVTVQCSGSDNINGSSSSSLGTQYSYLTAHCDGSNWFIIG